ncbi:hypothetical protein LUZ60_004205 [Juncus effusus]|nr:hypothetical protein LUZ60_004205 [Juncus effusus]
MAEEAKKCSPVSDIGKESRTNSPINNKGKKRENESSSSKKIEKGKKIVDSSDHEMHIWTERERRKKMRSMFSTLQTYLPQLPQKVDKATIVEEAVNYIKSLEQTLTNLQKRQVDKKKPPSAASSTVDSPDFSSARDVFFTEQTDVVTVVPLSPVQKPCFAMQTWTSPNVVLSIAGFDAFINVCAPKRQGLITAAAYFLDKHGAEAVSVQVYSDSQRSMFLMQAHAINGEAFHDGNPAPAEERFKLAMGEFILWLSSSSSSSN